jgi:hypothetical protein
MNHNSERDRVKERVTKLLNMTTDRGATEAEAIQAAERAAELMAQFDIEASELSIREARAIKQTAIVRKYGNLNVAVPCARHIGQLCVLRGEQDDKRASIRMRQCRRRRDQRRA